MTGSQGAYTFLAAWRDLWALLHPRAAAAAPPQAISALANLAQAICLDLYTGFRGLPDAAPLPEDRPAEVLREQAEWIVANTVTSFLEAHRVFYDPAGFVESAPSVVPRAQLVEALEVLAVPSSLQRHVPA